MLFVAKHIFYFSVVYILQRTSWCAQDVLNGITGPSSVNLFSGKISPHSRHVFSFLSSSINYRLYSVINLLQEEGSIKMACELFCIT